MWGGGVGLCVGWGGVGWGGVVGGGGRGLCGAGNKADQKRIHSWVGQPESVHTFGLPKK